MEENIYESAKRLIETEKYRLAAASLQHYLKLANEQLTIENITNGIMESVNCETWGDTRTLDEQLIKQARSLDTLFDYLLAQSNGKYSEMTIVDLALRAQRQAMNTTARLRAIQTRKQKNCGTD